MQAVEEKRKKGQQSKDARKSTSKGRIKKGLNLVTEDTFKASFCSPRNLTTKGAAGDASIVAAGY